MKKIVITRALFGEREHDLFAEFCDKRVPEQLEVYEEETSLLNRIYIGKVEQIQESIGAAFVRLTPDMHAFLPLSDAAKPFYTAKHSGKDTLSAGDELLVQIVKDPIKTKLAVLSAGLTHKGNYTILETNSSGIGVSHKIAREKAEELKQLAARIWPDDLAAGLILRTSAAEAPAELLVRDIEEQANFCRRTLQTASHKTLYSEIYTPEPAWLERLKGSSLADIDEIVTDIPAVFDRLTTYLTESFPTEKLRLYTDERYPLKTLYGLEHLLQKLMQKQVWLNSGSNIIIEQLETLTFIDVNSSKNQARGKDSVLKINKEAAAEIALQLRLRNISGMILIDFINMKAEEETELIGFLKKLLEQDPVKTRYMDMTKLGLVELTRKKVHKSLREIL